ncbi:UDP-N-acetylmuramoyl-tripeptide--D-alanyl-D-alanine ligase [Kangiella sp. HZ709]|uniref:UDP-N-acetylmuramoyl-tripeptide--D-alanyl-D- alanine ligase n=1 Tax=Kangiella sp. HZ709 TaxID=2666328 RepID=UPI0012B1157C|nr:UDP-N-acetylmuramoyl-tripeptide--D-alanyl-D-alanine ligase [Kangiella sp. HZ709]MRX27426.1 UDP-N-acetylmuramoyl-tripeptide--D-alanyl-D-alanine ligase [Kangiella sp. HZ709]
MISLPLSVIADAVNGELIGSDTVISEVFTDTRNAVADSLFVALKGENFDAHKFVKQAETQGAIALMVSQEVDSNLPQIKVSDTEKSLGLLANYVRKQVNPKVIGITGSAGKTSVKEMVATILQSATSAKEVLSTLGNFNNHIGVPLTLLRLTGKEKFAVVEMGANHIGEIAYCCLIAEPDVTVVNNVAPAHIEGFGSIEGVAKAKGEIYQALSKEGIGIVNLDSEFSEDYLNTEDFHKVTVSRHNSADFYAHNIKLNEDLCAEFEMQHQSNVFNIRVNVPGEHQVSNALVAAALTFSVGIDYEHIQSGLLSSGVVKGRLNRLKGIHGSSVIDDTYNASVQSVKVAVDVLSNWQGTKILVLGDMAELGEDSVAYHQEVGVYAKDKNIDHLYSVGGLSQFAGNAFGKGARHFDRVETLIDYLALQLSVKSQVLVKGSRSARMERVVAAIEAKQNNNQDVQQKTFGGGSQC